MKIMIVNNAEIILGKMLLDIVCHVVLNVEVVIGKEIAKAVIMVYIKMVMTV